MRFLLAMWFVIFCVMATATYLLPLGIPWWVPFAVPTGFIAVLVGAVLIAGDGHILKG